MSDILELAARCPWCNKGETLADKPADIRISARCNICRQFYIVDFKSLCVTKTTAAPRKITRKLIKHNNK